jgi:hypothetical protein
VRNIFELTKTPYVDLEVEATCESCGHAYSGTTRIVAIRYPCSVLPFIPTQAERVREKMEAIFEGNYSQLSVMRCPKCTYVQSWNIVGLKREIATRAAILTRAAVLLVMLVLGLDKWSEISYALWTILVMVVASALVHGLARLALKLYDPNRRHEPTIQANPPRIVVTKSLP